MELFASLYSEHWIKTCELLFNVSIISDHLFTSSEQKLKKLALILNSNSFSVVLSLIPPGQYVPQLNATLGTNFFDPDYKMLRVLVRGSEPVEIRTSPVLFLAFELPAMTEDEFFGDNLVQNLATFLKVPPNMIRITKIIREDGGARRRKRSTGLKVEVEIQKPPVQQTTNSTNGQRMGKTKS